MKMPPLILVLKIRRGKVWTPGIWIPLFLIWPLVILLVGPFLIVGFLLALVMGTGADFVKTSGGLFDILCATRGTEFDFDGKGTEVSLLLK